MAKDQITALLLDTSRQLFADGCDHELQQSAEQGQFPADLWSAIEDNGLPLALVPESADGVGLGLEEAFKVLRVAGAFALPLPLAETMIATHLLSLAGIEVPPGTLTFCGLSRALGAGVPWLGATEHAVFVEEQGSQSVSVSLVKTDAVLAATLGGIGRDLAGDPRGDLLQAPESTDRLESGEVELSITDVEALGALSRVAMTAGALDRILDLCIEHATGRVQFGRPVGKFQAVQNLVAIVAGEAAAVGVSAPAAVRSFAADRDLFAVGCAKARSCEAASAVARLAHQIHAAIGYTQEHILHRFTRRLWSWRDHFGDESYWSERVGTETVAAGADRIWERLAG